MKLFIVRHGQTVQNVSGICQGHSIGELNEVGISQAKKLALRLREESFKVIYSSDSPRALDTAKEIAVFHPDISLVSDERLRERFMGSLEGFAFPENLDWNNLPEGCEDNQSIFDRAKSIIDEVLAKYSDDVLIVCHGGTKHALLTVLNGKSSTELNNMKDLKNTSLSVFEISEDNNHRMVVFNCTKHLD